MPSSSATSSGLNRRISSRYTFVAKANSHVENAVPGAKIAKGPEEGFLGQVLDHSPLAAKAMGKGAAWMRDARSD